MAEKNNFFTKIANGFKSFFSNIKKKFSSKDKDNSASYGARVQRKEEKLGRRIDNQHEKRKAGGAVSGETVVFSESELPKTTKIDLNQTIFVPKQKKEKRTSLSPFVPRTKKPLLGLGIVLNVFKFGLVAIFVLVAVAAGAVSGLASAYLETTPELDVGKIESQDLTSYIYDSDSELLAVYTGSENRDWATIEEIPEHLQKAVIAVEDIRFYSHNGVDIKRLAGALVSNLTSSTSEGGSTITQQLIKNSLLTNERSYKRKIQEAYLAMELEKNYTKDEILEAYMNTIPLGGTLYGVKSAAKDYFGKDLSELTLKQMVCLAAITQYPYKYNPRTATYKNADVSALQNRMNIVTERMYSAGFITKEEYDATFVPKEEWEKPGYLAKWKAEMGVLESSPSNELYKYPHFVEYVIYDVETHFLRKYGWEDTAENRAKIEQEIRSNGYNIYATVDPAIQETVQTTLSEWDNYPDFVDSNYNVTVDSNGIETIQPQSSAVVIDQTKGEIVALVGSRDEPSAKKTYNRAYQGAMPVGSSIKPITVYTPAFDLGLSPASPIANIPVPITGWDSETGYPTTSQGTYGPVSIRQGVVSSLNIVAARTLMDHVGIDTAADYLIKMGVDPEHISYTGVGLSLGGSTLTPLEMTTCYATIANGGYYLEPVSFTTVTDQSGKVILDSSDTRKQYQVYEETSAWMIVDVLTEAVESGTGTRAKIEGITTAGKTGTVVDNKGVFFAGMTPYYTSALWVGHDMYEPFASGTAASNSSAPLWRTYMTKILEGKEDKSIINETPETLGLVEASVCQYTGLLPSGGCPTFTDYFAPGTVPLEHCSGHSTYTLCTESGMLATPNCPTTTTYVDSASLPESSPYKSWSGNTPVNTTQYCTLHGGGGGETGDLSYAHSVVGALGSAIAERGGSMSPDQLAELQSLLANLQSLLASGARADQVNGPASAALNRMNEILGSIG